MAHAIEWVRYTVSTDTVNSTDVGEPGIRRRLAAPGRYTDPRGWPAFPFRVCLIGLILAGDTQLR